MTITTTTAPTTAVSALGTARARRVLAVPTLAARRLALSVRSPRSLVIPVLNPVLFALVLAPALANSTCSSAVRFCEGNSA